MHTMDNYFFITGMPRTMSAWLSVFLTNDDDIWCFHEGSKNCYTHQEYIDRLARMALNMVWTGDANSSLAWFPLEKYYPEAPVLILHRDIDDVIQSLEKIVDVSADMITMLAMTNNILKEMKGMHMHYLEVHHRIEEVWEYLIGGMSTFPGGRYHQIKQMNITTMTRHYDQEAITSFITDNMKDNH